MTKNALIITLGCRLNHADTALLSTRLAKAGYNLIDESEKNPDLIILNSCAITAEAERKSHQLLRKLRKNHPAATIIATGCAAESAPEKMLTSGADKVISNPGKKDIFSDFPCHTKSNSLPPLNFTENGFSSFPFRSRAFIKIQEGCDNCCSYCIVPTVRGRSRSRKFKECIDDCINAINNGFPEIVLTGVNTCNYFDDGKTLPDLIKEIASVPGEFRIRLSSTEPHPGDMSLIEMMADDKNKLCRFLHLSMQHGSDKILRAMYRRYTVEEFIDFAEKAKKIIPDIHLGSDFIVGFPGETDDDFEQLCKVVQDVVFANIHAFIYSVRPGTPAAELPEKIAPEISKMRIKRLMELGNRTAEQFAKTQIGKILPVIFETEKNGFIRGWSDNYLAVKEPSGAFPLGKIVHVTGNEKNLAENLKNHRCGGIL